MLSANDMKIIRQSSLETVLIPVCRVKDIEELWMLVFISFVGVNRSCAGVPNYLWL